MTRTYQRVLPSRLDVPRPRLSTKPHFLLVPIALEIWLLARTRRALIWLAPETIALAVTGFVCAAAIVVYAPAYIERVVPDALLGYWVSNSPLPTVVFAGATLLAPVGALVVLGYLTLRDGERTPALAQAFGIAGAASLVFALIQMKPWPYHFLPSVLYCGLCAAALLLLGKPRAGANNIRLGAIAVLVAMSFRIRRLKSFAASKATAPQAALLNSPMFSVQMPDRSARSSAFLPRHATSFPRSWRRE